MNIKGLKTKLNIGDHIIFLVETGGVQIIRCGHKILDDLGNDITSLGNSVQITENLCLSIVKIIAMTHGFGVQNLSYLYGYKGRLYYFRFTELNQSSKNSNISTQIFLD